jgi:hypothetical protein
MPSFIHALVLFGALAAPHSPDEAPLVHRTPEAGGWRAYKVLQAAKPDKSGQITVSCPVAWASIDEKEFRGIKGYLTLHDPEPNVIIELALKNPQLRDRLEVRIAPSVVSRLQKLGIRDVAAHFKGSTVKVTGASTQVIYLCMPAACVTTVVVDRIEDLEVVGS